MPFVSVAGAEIHFEAIGQGPPLILISGMGGLASYWAPQLEVLSKLFRVLTFDHRGTGRSTHSEVEYSVELLASDTIGLMDGLGIEAAHFLGHSTGGMMLQVISSTHPARVLSQVLYGTRGRTDEFTRRAMGMRKEIVLGAGVDAYVKSTPVFLYPSRWIAENAAELATREALAVKSSAAPAILASRLDAVLRHNQIEALSRIEAPTLVTCARDDFLTPIYYSEELAELIPRAKLSLVSGGGHACSATNPAEFNGIVLEFFRSVTAERAGSSARPRG
ncbi:alpha/beta fold hydrolase [Bradyrhizobium elkanii]|uniref:Aminoacrylate hydrolase n=1 Tax=Bradyrhizobium elkanii TaxID=29448 RepID=A0A8I1YDT0_BRAEL|nr:alpha/beta fold hydrolase [Bradyrhizobium elkanii]MBP1296411.1 aminoacrylate hydrolase [Bradyrhizobium elkanii]